MVGKTCCVCASAQQNCRQCTCAKSGKKCTNCRRGGECRNQGKQQSPEVGSDQLGNVESEEDGSDAMEMDMDSDLRSERELQEGRDSTNLRPEDANPPHLERQGEREEGRFWQTWQQSRAKEWLDDTYNRIIAFSPGNLFTPPKCNASKRLIEEMTNLLRAYINSSLYAPMVFKTLAILPHLTCQRTHRKSKHSENVQALQRRMEKWEKGEVEQLLMEAEAIQDRLNKGINRKKSPEDKARNFADKMRQGKVAAAMRTLAGENEDPGVLPLNEETIKILKEKHPIARPANLDSKFNGDYLPPHKVVFDSITRERIWNLALHTQGAAGPSGLDASGWKCLLSTSLFGTAAVGLQEAIAGLAKKLASEDCQHLEAYTACRIIPLDKKPGCRPIESKNNVQFFRHPHFLCSTVCYITCYVG
ncbi:uncharacterized protein LOC143028975 [Oratosquilla oratoria]|uniref:uncharacterized protein LOC143028975 n=1 Tax=Oratosquilla oratoria TaxID=337810 RepID=UPI003F7765D2